MLEIMSADISITNVRENDQQNESYVFSRLFLFSIFPEANLRYTKILLMQNTREHAQPMHCSLMFLSHIPQQSNSLKIQVSRVSHPPKWTFFVWIVDAVKVYYQYLTFEHFSYEGFATLRAYFYEKPAPHAKNPAVQGWRYQTVSNIHSFWRGIRIRGPRSSNPPGKPQNIDFNILFF